MNQAFHISLQLLWSLSSEFHPAISHSVYRNIGSDNLHWQQALGLEAKIAVGSLIVNRVGGRHTPAVCTRIG
jgi:hypothetical protein